MAVEMDGQEGVESSFDRALIFERVAAPPRSQDRTRTVATATATLAAQSLNRQPLSESRSSPIIYNILILYNHTRPQSTERIRRRASRGKRLILHCSESSASE